MNGHTPSARLPHLIRLVMAIGILVLAANGPAHFSLAPHLYTWVSAAPAGDIGGLSFSEAIDAQAEPIWKNNVFDRDVERLWVSFNYYSVAPGAKVSYTITFNGEDWQGGPLTCCDGSDGRYAFPIERERDRNLSGGGYLVIIWVGGAEASRGFFSVAGTDGGDNENTNENADHRGNLSNKGDPKEDSVRRRLFR
jgi:hypothetical protein